MGDRLLHELSLLGGGGHPIIGVINLSIWAFVLLVPFILLWLILDGRIK